ncbi:pyridoxamine 5'-phosphate oxidase family protein [Brevibacterium jeotgali]|uniref:General stress protein 26 n=1 Tax=Brevibacterium jeotgali TaxID=1262550 RepID=A0A2H1L8M0_9MICO|nr:pyridoxamine 5'-phosphate oxidase family protein [Brevibacterium jeotgali]TWC03209.1 general stress protein 26 [Brevibacterium jeotgali]SMY12733.1 General stress protein 26 [Brevibacterium jeotgali]
MKDITQQDVAHALSSAPWVMVTTARHDGKLLAHPMVPQQVTDNCDVWFFLSLAGDQSEALRQGPQVNLSVAEAGTWLSVSGHVEFVEDQAKIDELWNDRAAEWFEGGRTDPALGLIRVSTDSAQFWGTPGGKARSIAELVKSRVTGDEPAGGSDTVPL